jgi:hypothetical protein
MTLALSRKHTRSALCCVMVIGAASGASWPESDHTNTIYFNDQRASSSSSGYALCLHMGMGPALICDPNFIAPSSHMVVERTPPKIVMTEMTKGLTPQFVSELVSLHADTQLYTISPVGRVTETE